MLQELKIKVSWFQIHTSSALTVFNSQELIILLAIEILLSNYSTIPGSSWSLEKHVVSRFHQIKKYGCCHFKNLSHHKKLIKQII